MTRPRCDAHVHVWDPAVRDHSWLAAEDPLLRRRFDLDDYARDASPGPDDQVVLVQVLADLDETVETLGDAAGADLVAGVVGWVDLEAPDVADRLARLADEPGGEKLVGVRHLVQSEPDPHWLARPAVRRGLGAVARAGLAYDLLVRPRQLRAATDVARALPDARFVLDHGAKPEIGASTTEPWWSLVGELARCENVSCKVSGLVTEAGRGWTTEQVRPYVERLLESFGPARLMFGSDWPVCTAEATFAEVVALAHDTLASLSEAEADAFLSGTAHKAYALPRATAGA
ncbi:MAG: amidohydrolase family protein [Acidimicrobiales bacterium]